VNAMVSRAWIYGKWTEFEVVSTFAAARRTVEGGRGMRDEDWAFGPREKPSDSTSPSSQIAAGGYEQPFGVE
jgi:hypothetical protein